MRTIKRLIYFFSLFFFLCLRLHALPTDPFFIQHFDNRNGLSNSSINTLFNDGDDLLWVATWDGLNMYDGTTFHVFNYSKENDFKSIGSNVIQNIIEDKFKNIWISTIEGVSRYEKNTGRFYNYFYDEDHRGKISEQEYAIAVDSSGTVYCFSQKGGLSYYDAAIDSFRVCSLPQKSSKITKVAFDHAGHLWVLTNNGELNVFVKNKNNFELFYSFGEKKDVTNFFVLNEGIFFATKSDHLYSVNMGTLVKSEIMQMPHSLSSMIFYQDHYLLAWASKGYNVFDKNFSPSTFLDTATKQMEDIKITSLELGTEDILWFGTDGNGIIKIYPKTKSFGTVATSENGMPYNKSVRAFCEENGNLWIGTKGSGIIKMQNFWSSSGSIKKQYFLAPKELDNNAVYALKKGTDGLIYIGSDGKGIEIYDLKNKKFKKWSSIKGYNVWPEFGSVYAISQDEDQSVWLGTSGYGLIHLKINGDQKGNLSIAFLERFTFNNNDTGPANDIIYSLCQGGKDQLWIGCRYGGLSLLNKRTKKFRNFKAFTYDGSLSNNDVLSVFKDSRDRIWVGTSYGLNMINSSDALKKEPVFQKLTTLNGLPNNTIHAIEEDGSQQIWVSTNKGLAKVNPADFKVSYYQQSDGLQSNEFCDGAVWKDKEGNLFFGGTYGFNNFLPQNIHKTNWLPNLTISEISIGGKTVKENGFTVLKRGGATSLHYSISRSDNFFELNVKALSFLNGDKCEYAYLLEGYDKTWHYGGTNGKITYSNILPGSYILKVKWSNGEGTWSQEMPLLKVEVKQYLWLTPIAFLIYIVIISAIIFIVYKYRKNKLEIKHQLQVEHLMRKKEDEIHQNRLGFFTNIAHELQTPLTLIMGATERFLDHATETRSNKEKPYFLSLIHQQASKLTYLVHQLLEFRKVESGFFENQYNYIDITELFYNLTAPFITLSDKKAIRYEVDIKGGILGFVDKDKVEKIIFNLLSNAFKYCERNEQVIFTAAENKMSDGLEITVANSGIQLSSEQLSLIFDKFYVAQQNHGSSDKFGTGIGLAFTRELVAMLKGKITVHNENGWIFFKVLLPLKVEHLEINRHIISDQPSYLFRTITTYNDNDYHVSTKENNKEAIFENLLEQDKKSILVVEDEPEIHFLLKDILKEDYIVYQSKDGIEALDLMGKVLPDMIICDVMMPNMSGLELCNKIKNDVATCQVPFILLTARGSEEHSMEGYESGADAYIAKPFNTAHLKLRIRKLLEYRQKLHDIFKSNAPTDSLHETDMPETDKVFLMKLADLIEKNIEDVELNAALLEKEFCMSKMQLYRKLKSLTEMTPSEFIKYMRLKATAQLLTTSNFTVSEIFYRTGFNNQSYFFREFKKRYGCAPNEYREQNAVRK